MTTAIEKPNGNGNSKMPEPAIRRGISEAQWLTLRHSLFPGAKELSVILVWDYCLARRLDPMKKPCHIVPMEIKVGDQYEWRDVVMPGIYELRTTAQRTGQYLGHAKAEYGPPTEYAGITAPEWCEFTVYRWNPLAEMKAEYPVRILFCEVVATKRDGKANARWSKAPTQMLTKCSEAASLREAFPDELGGVQAEEEMDGQRAIDVVPTKVDPPIEKPADFDQFIANLTMAADAGEAEFAGIWKAASPDCRNYLTSTEPDGYEYLRNRAAQAHTVNGELA